MRTKAALRWRRYAVGVCTVLFLVTGVPPGMTADQIWSPIEPGLDRRTINFRTDRNAPASISVIRVNPNVFDIDLLMASDLGTGPLTPKTWAETYDAVLVINASMYQKDHRTSVGHLRRGDHINNALWHKNYGAYLVSGPKTAGLPTTAILDRTADDWSGLQERYRIVVQAHRMIDSRRNSLWITHKRRHAIAALGQDTDGRLLFIFCADAVSVQDFIAVLLEAPIALTRLMYLEGSKPAGMHLRTDATSETWLGRNESSRLNAVPVPVPNVLAVRRKAD